MKKDCNPTIDEACSISYLVLKSRLAVVESTFFTSPYSTHFCYFLLLCKTKFRHPQSRQDSEDQEIESLFLSSGERSL